MQFRYREMVYRPDHYGFHNEDREEWFPNGIFNYNVSRLIKDLDEHDKGNNSEAFWLNTVVKVEISVDEVLKCYYKPDNLEDDHVQAADLKRPLIFVELAPDCFNLVDGHHRIEKARREGVKELPAWMVDSHAAIHYLGSEFEYSRYVEYWNTKIENISDLVAYRGLFSPCPAPLQDRDLADRHIWNRMSMCLNECRQIEVYSEGKWFTLFRLNGKLFCGESEEHGPSIRCQTPFQISFEKIGIATELFADWYGEQTPLGEKRERRKEIRKILRHADELMACIRVFSEY